MIAHRRIRIDTRDASRIDRLRYLCALAQITTSAAATAEELPAVPPFR